MSKKVCILNICILPDSVLEYIFSNFLDFREAWNTGKTCMLLRVIFKRTFYDTSVQRIRDNDEMKDIFYNCLLNSDLEKRELCDLCSIRPTSDSHICECCKYKNNYCDKCYEIHITECEICGNNVCDDCLENANGHNICSDCDNKGITFKITNNK